ncbi:hypothetical protein BT63DRAFT_258973 [Microthyrium microscopicum]|uniref:LIM zinc-binding domain-containing protein n=1 Tax=Microthyrium microscopicum TaxID=703497 RepID=A0A6A6UBP7_9PEZI|nr:hypothetical protein BT63DRAFT_258973 [Microthyrium microscopicum]
MDPITITTTVVKLTASCLSTAKALNTLRNQFNDAPMTIVSICSETTVIAASLSQIQSLVLTRDNISSILRQRPEFASALDTALVGCMVLFSCLDEEVRRLSRSTSPAARAITFGFRDKVRALWNNDRLKELLDALRGQQTSITLLIQLLHTESLASITQLLNSNQPTLSKNVERTQSLRRSIPGVRIPESIYSAEDEDVPSVYSYDPTGDASSAIEFEFDDMIINSQVYRKVVAAAMSRTPSRPTEEIEGDLIDLSDAATIKAGHEDDSLTGEASRELATLMLSETRTTVVVEEPSAEPILDPTAEDSESQTRHAPVAEKLPDDTASSTVSDMQAHSQASENAMTSARSKKSMPVSPKPRSEKSCHKCGEPLYGQFVRALNTIYHLDCFTCSDCGKNVASSFFPLEGQEDKVGGVVLCETDYFKRLDLVCATCGGALRGSYITALDQKYHLEHFVCQIDTCVKVFGEDESYYQHEGHVYCRAHYAYLFSEDCFGCKMPILKQFVEGKRGGKDVQWHPECYMIQKYWGVDVATSLAAKKDSNGTISWKNSKDQVIGPDALDQLLDPMDDLTNKLWKHFSALEESVAENLSSMVTQISQGKATEVLLPASKLLFDLQTIFGAISAVSDDLIKGREGDIYSSNRYPEKDAVLLHAHMARLLDSGAMKKYRSSKKAKKELSDFLAVTCAPIKNLIKFLLNEATRGLSIPALLSYMDQRSSVSLTSDYDQYVPRPFALSYRCRGCAQDITDSCFHLTDFGFDGRRMNQPAVHSRCLQCHQCKRSGGFEIGLSELSRSMTSSKYWDGPTSCHFCKAGLVSNYKFVSKDRQLLFSLWNILCIFAQGLQLRKVISTGSASHDGVPVARDAVSMINDKTSR